MKIFHYFPILAAALLAWHPAARADTDEDEEVCHENLLLDGSDLAPKFAPSPNIEISHLALDITPDFEKSTISGTAVLTFKPMGKPLEELRLDAVDLAVTDLSSSDSLAGWQAADKEIVINFASPIPLGHESRVTIRYSAKPTEGLYFRTPATGYDAGDAEMWTQGEPMHARHWFPCYDYPNAKFTSDITCHVPDGMIVLSNGRQVSATKDASTGLTAVRWAQEKPLVSYLITLVAGKFSKIDGDDHGIPLPFYTPPSMAKEAPLTADLTKPAMEFLEQEIGVPYPWAKYGQVVVLDFTAGGMENTSMTTLTDRTLHRADTETLTTSENLVSHEMTHQWFGDLVTCKDWSQIWLNEGFAVFYANLFTGHLHGHDAFLYGLYTDAQQIFSHTELPAKPIVFRNYDNPMQQFDYRAYPKGSWVLQMLRSQLGEDLYRRCIKTYLERHQYQVVVTEDLNKVIEELSGRSWDQFFDQWLYRPGQPELQVDYAWDEKTKLARVSVTQTQKLVDRIPLFRFPLTLRFKMKGAAIDRTVEVKDEKEDFYVPLPGAPEIVRIDPDFTVLAKVTFKPASAMLYAQLADQTDMIGRLLAAETLADDQNDETIARLKQTLNSDPFYGVRAKAAESLRKIHNDAAFQALTASIKQPDARARRAVVDAIAGFYREQARDALRAAIETEKNPAILSSELTALGPYHDQKVHDLLLRYLKSDSFRNALADAAIAAMRIQDDPAYIAPLRETLAARKAAFTSRSFAAALDTLAFLARNEKVRNEPREFIAGFTNDKRDFIQVGAIKALGSLEDPAALGLLQTFASASKNTKQQDAAEKAITAIGDAGKPADNLKDVRDQMLELQKQERELKTTVDNLKKQIEATREKSPKPKTSGT